MRKSRGCYWYQYYSETMPILTQQTRVAKLRFHGLPGIAGGELSRGERNHMTSLLNRDSGRGYLSLSQLTPPRYLSRPSKRSAGFDIPAAIYIVSLRLHTRSIPIGYCFPRHAPLTFTTTCLPTNSLLSSNRLLSDGLIIPVVERCIGSIEKRR